jgi:hypothetical protein
MRTVHRCHILTQHAVEVTPRAGLVAEIAERRGGHPIDADPGGSVALLGCNGAEPLGEGERRAMVTSIGLIDG